VVEDARDEKSSRLPPYDVEYQDREAPVASQPNATTIDITV